MALIATFEELPYCIVGMEACLSAHFVSRTLRKLGFEPRIIPAIYVQPFNKGQKNGYNDAEAIAEAALRPNLKTVTEKTQEQLDLQALHRVRSRLVSRRTVSIVWNGIRRTQSLRAQMVIIDQVSNETAARAYSQQGYGKNNKPIQRPDTYQRLLEDVQLNSCEQQPVHTLGSSLQPL